MVELAISKTASKRGIIDFSQQLLPQGNYSLNYTLKGYADQAMQNVVVEAGKFNFKEIILVKNGGGGGTTTSAPTTTTDVNGNYTLSGVASGSIDIKATLPGMLPMPPAFSMTKNVNVQAGQTTTLNFDF
ncbi:MAG: carboxypeptidase regulatory-like domain-containing protein [Flavobacteriales bacterium]|nr:carboxypeptidase regulatory-like domain-containing protein [Flavobacteriales bacterium]